MNDPVIISVGHGKSKSGGYDPGAVNGEYHEFSIAKMIAGAAVRELWDNGTGAQLLNYYGDTYLTERIKAVNRSSCGLCVEVHLNAGGGTGTECYYSRSSPEAKKYAAAISEEVSAALGIRNRGAKTKVSSSGRDYFGIIRQTGCPCVLVECAFIDSQDIEKIRTAACQEECGRAIARAIEKVRQAQTLPFRVKISCGSLNVRSGAGTAYPAVMKVKQGEIYTIVSVDSTGRWGKLKSGAGYICISDGYVTRVGAA